MMYGKVENMRLVVAERVFTPEGLFEANADTPVVPEGWFLFDGVQNTAELDDNNMPVLNRRQMLLTLLTLGITEAQVDAQIDAIADPVQKESARIYWKESTKYNRNHPLVSHIASTLSLNSEQVDQAWIAALTVDSES